MKLEIKLNDPKYCNRCPCLDACGKEEFCAQYTQEKLVKEKDRFRFKRPQICIKQNGR